MKLLFKLKYLILFVLTPVVILIDQWTKQLIIDRFELGQTQPLVSGFFNLTYVRNTGAAFGMLRDAHPSFRVPFFMIVPMLALLVIGYVFYQLPAKDKKLSTAFSLVVGGAIGNLIDRIHYGYVIDFLDFHWKYVYHFPAFNVADSAICVGVAILMLDLAFRQEESVNASATR